MDIILEKSVHGTKWNNVHDGYFSDKKVLAPLMSKIIKQIEISSPDVVVDVGGGTGFLLATLEEQRSANTFRLVNVDISKEQLEQIHNPLIQKIHSSFTQIQRSDLTKVQNEKVMIIGRSFMHYVKKENINRFLTHLRSQMSMGEYFIHQTACFLFPEDAECLNFLYKEIGTDKWYPTLLNLSDRLLKNGFEVMIAMPTSPLTLKMNALGSRYSIPNDDMLMIRERMSSNFGEREGVIEFSENDFKTLLHYQVIVCRAR